MLMDIIYVCLKDFQVLRPAITECRRDDWELNIIRVTGANRWEKTVPLYFVPAAWLLFGMSSADKSMGRSNSEPKSPK
jgi:hypothetical protein